MRKVLNLALDIQTRFFGIGGRVKMFEEQKEVVYVLL